MSDTSDYVIDSNFTIFVKNEFPQRYQFTEVSNITMHAGKLLDTTLPLGLFYDNEQDKLTYEAVLIDNSPLPSWLNFI